MKNCFPLDHPYLLSLVLTSIGLMLLYVNAKIAERTGKYREMPALLAIWGFEGIVLIPALMLLYLFVKFFYRLC